MISTMRSCRPSILVFNYLKIFILSNNLSLFSYPAAEIMSAQACCRSLPVDKIGS